MTRMMVAVAIVVVVLVVRLVDDLLLLGMKRVTNKQGANMMVTTMVMYNINEDAC